MNSFQASSIFETGRSQVQIRKDLSVFDYIFGPVFVNNSHWCLFFIFNKLNKITFIDPKGESNDQLNSAIINWT
jgi:Ulp1 family protease